MGLLRWSVDFRRVFSVCGKPQEKCHRFWLRLRHAVILILNVRTSASKNKPDGVNPNSDDIDYYVRKNERKIRWFLADCFLVICRFRTHFRGFFLSKIIQLLKFLEACFYCLKILSLFSELRLLAYTLIVFLKFSGSVAA